MGKETEHIDSFSDSIRRYVIFVNTCCKSDIHFEKPHHFLKAMKMLEKML